MVVSPRLGAMVTEMPMGILRPCGKNRHKNDILALVTFQQSPLSPLSGLPGSGYLVKPKMKSWGSSREDDHRTQKRGRNNRKTRRERSRRVSGHLGI